MKPYLLFSFLLFTFSFSFSQNIDGNKLPKCRKKGVKVAHTGYVSYMSKKHNLPMWVFHSISQSIIKDQPSQKRPNDYPNDSLFNVIPRNAYNTSGYDHGHLAPAADFKWSADAYYQSHYMTNMSPQHGCLNQKGWCQLETLVRNWACENPESQFYVVSGPVLNDFIDTLCLTNEVKIYVPKYYYKVVLEEKSGFTSGVGYIVPNGNVENERIKDYRVSIDSVEHLTKLNFFPHLKRKYRKMAEKVVGNYSHEYKSECGKKSCKSIYSKRELPEERKVLRCNEKFIMISEDIN